MYRSWQDRGPWNVAPGLRAVTRRPWLAAVVTLFLAMGSASSAPGQSTYSFSGTSTSWLSGATWTLASGPGNSWNYPGTTSGLLNTDIAILNGVGSTFNIAFGSSGTFSLATLEITSSQTGGLTFGNSSGTNNGALYLNGSTVNGYANTILSDFSTKAFTVSGTASAKSLTLELVNANNVVQLVSPSTGSTGKMTISANIAETVAGHGLTFVGGGSSTGKSDGEFFLSGTNNFTGGTTLGDAAASSTGYNAAEVNITNVNALPTAGTITVNTFSSFILNVAGGATFAQNLILNGQGDGGVVQNAAFDFVQSATWAGGITLNTNAKISSDVDGTISGSITGTALLTKSGGATLNITGANNAAWGTVVSNGTLSVGVGAAIGTGSFSLGQTTNKNDVVVFNNAAQQVGNFSSSFVSTLSQTQAITLNGTILSILQTGNTTFGVTTATTGQMAVINGTGSVALMAGSTGTLTFSGNNNYTGGTTVNGGTLVLAGQFSSVLASGGALAVNGGTLNITTVSQGISGLTMTNGTISGTTGILTSNSDFAMQSGTVSAVLDGFVAINKTTAGTLTLSSPTGNTYQNGTTINAGTVFISNASGSALGFGTTTVASGATLLADVAALNSTLTISGGHLDLLSGSSLLTLNNGLGVNNGSVLDLVVNGASNSTIALNSSSVTLSGTVTINIAGSATAGTYHLLTYGSETGGNFVLGTTPGGGLNYQLQTLGNEVDLVVAPSGRSLLWSATSNPANVSQVSDGGGTWTNASGLNFWDGTQATTWNNSNPDNATFGASPGGAGGTVNLGSNIVAESITFAPVASPYTIAGNGFFLTLAGSIVANNSATIAAPIVVSNSQNWSVTNSSTLAVTGNITEFGGARTLTLSGPGTIALSGTNSYSGGTVINGATVVIASSSSLGMSTANLTFSGGAGTLRLGTAGVNSARAVALNAAASIDTNGFNLTLGGAVTGANTLTKLSAGTLALGATGSFGGLVVSGGTVDIGTTTQTVSSVSAADGTTITGTSGVLSATAFNLQNANLGASLGGGGTLTMSGFGTATLSGANSYTGGTWLNSGTLSISKDSNLGSATTAVTFNGGALQTTAGFSSARSLIATNSGTFDTGGAATTFSGTLTGTGSLVVTGGGSLAFTGNINLPTGGVSVLGAGTSLIVAQGNTNTLSLGFSLGQFTGNVVSANGARINFIAPSGTIDGGGQIQVQGNGGTISLNNTSSGFLDIQNNIVLNSLSTSGAFKANLGATSGNTLTIDSTISGASDVNFAAGTSGGAGTIYLNKAALYTGTTYIDNSSSGVVRLGDNGVLPATTVLSFGDGVNSGNVGAVDLNGFNQTISGLTSNLLGSSTAGGVVNNSFQSATLNILGSAVTTYAGPVGGTGTGVLALNLAAGNTGTLFLTAGNTYTGGTTISGGALVVANGVTGSALGTGDVNVFGGKLGSDAVLGGSIAGNVTISGGTLTPGNGAIGTMSITGGLTSTTGSTFSFNLSAGNQSSLINVGGALSLSGTALSLTGATAGTYSLINFNTDTNNSSFSSILGIGSLHATESIVGNVLQLVLTAGGSTLTWTANTASQIDGSGTWTNNAGTNFFNGSSNVKWDNTAQSNVVFGLSPAGNGGTVTLGSTITASSITFAPQTSGTIYSLVLHAGDPFSITVTGGITATNSAMISAPLTVAADQAWVTNPSATLTVSGNVGETAGAHVLTLSGGGTVALLGTNNYSGGTFIGAGTAIINNSSSLGSGGTTLSAATLEVAASATGGALTLSSATSTVRVDSGATYNLTGAVFGAGALNVTGAGTLTLSNANNAYLGGTSLQGGTLSINSDTTLGASSGNITFSGGALQTTASFTSSDRNMKVAVATTSIFDTDGVQTTFTGNLTGSGSLNLIGGGSLAMAGAGNGNVSLTGGFTIAAGTSLIFNEIGNTQTISAGAPGSNSFAGNLVLNGATIVSLNGTGAAVDGGGQIKYTTSGAALISAGTSTVTITNSIVINPAGSGPFSAFLGATNGGTLTVAGNISGTGDLILSNSNNGAAGGKGLVVLAGNDSYSGITQILLNNSSGTYGVVQLGSNTALPAATTVTFGTTGSAIAGVLDMAGFSATVSGISAPLIDNTATVGGIVNGGGSTSTLTILGTTSNTFASTLGGNVLTNHADSTSSPIAASNIALVLGTSTPNSYTGTLTLSSGANAYTGGTWVNSGTLVVANGATGSALGTGGATVTGGILASVAGTGGTVGGNVTVSGGMLAPGNGSIGGLSISGNLTSTAGSTFSFALGSTNQSSTINVGNVLNLTGTTLSLSNAVAGTYTLITFSTDTGNSSFSSVIGLGGLNYSESIVGNSLQLILTAGNPNLVWNGTANKTWDVGSSTNWLNGGSSAAFANGNNVTFTDVGTGTVTVAAGGVQPGTVTVTTSGIYTFSGAAISGTSFNKDGVGTLFLANSNTYSGAATVTNGVVTMTGSGILAASGVTVSGTLNLTTSGNAFGSTTGVTVTTGGTMNVSTSQSIASLLGSGGTVGVASGATMTLGGGSYSGTLNGAGAVMITAGSGNTVTFGGTNAYTGGTTVTSGTLQVLSGSSLSTSSNLTVAASAAANFANIGQQLGTLNNSGVVNFIAATGTTTISSLTGAGTTNVTNNANINQITVGTVSIGGTLAATTISGGAVRASGAVTVGTLSGGSVTFAGAVANTITSLTASPTLTLSQAGTSVSISGGIFGGTIQGLGSVTITGNTTFTGANLYSGGSTINSGATFVAANSSGSALGSGLVTVSGTLAAPSTGGSIGGTVTVNSGGTVAPGFNGAGVLNLSSTMTLNSGSIVSFGTIGSSGTLNLISNANLIFGSGTETFSFSGPINAPTVIKLAGFTGGTYSGQTANFGNVILSGLALGSGLSATLSGTTNPNELDLVVTHNTTGNLTWNGTSLKTWDVGTSTNWLDSGNSVKFATGNNVTFTDVGAGTVTVASGGVQPGTVTVTNSAAGAYTFTGAAMNGTSFNKDGVGTLFLANSNTYSGAATVTNGIVTMTGSGILAASGVTVSGTLNLTTSGNALGSTTGVTVTTGGTMNVSTSQSIASLLGSGGIVGVASGATMTLGGGSYSGALNGAGAVMITAGSGNTVTFGGTNAYTGGTTVTSGTLQVLSGSSLSTSSNLTVAASAAANFANIGQQLGTLNNSGVVNFTANSGTITLSSLTGAGATSFASNANVPSISTGTVSVAGNLTAATGISGGNVSVTGSANLGALSGGNVTITGAATIGAFSGSSTALSLSAATGSITTLNGTGALTLSGTNLSVTGGGNFTGSLHNGANAGQLSITGGTLTLGGTDALTGGINIQSGTLSVGTQAALGTNTLNFNAGTLHVTSSIDESAASVTIASGGATINIDSGSTLTLTGSKISGAGNISEIGGGTLFIIGNYTGNTTVSPNSTFEANPNSSNNVTLDHGATLLFNGAGTYNMNLTISPDQSGGTVTISNTTGGVINLTGTINKSDATLVLGGSGEGSYLLNAVISSGNAIHSFDSDLQYTMTTSIGIAQTYDGPTTISNNVTVTSAVSPNAMPQGTVLHLGSGTSTGSYDLAGNTQTIAGVISEGTGANNSITSSGTGTGSLFVAVATGTDNFAGSLTGHMNVSKEGAGTLELSGSQNTYTGGTTIDAGTLQLGADSALPVATTVTLSGTGALDLQGHTQRIVGLVSTDTGTTVTGTTGNLTISPSSAIATAFAGAINGGTSLTVNGASGSSQSLNGTNLYTGTTTVNSGALLVNGSISGTGGAVTVSSGGTLGGTGTITRDVVVGGTISPGNSGQPVGTMTIGSSSGTPNNLTINSAFAEGMSLVGTTSTADHIALNNGNTSQGTVAFGGSSELDLTYHTAAADPKNGDAFWATDHAWSLIGGSFTNPGSSILSKLQGADGFFDPATHRLDYAGVGYFEVGYANNSIQLEWTASLATVPEPGTMLLGAIAVGGLGLRHWRRRKAEKPAA